MPSEPAALTSLAEAALALTAATTIEDVLREVTELARTLTGAAEAVGHRAGATGADDVVYTTPDGSPAGEDGALTVPLLSRGGTELGTLQLLARRRAGAFTAADRAILVQLAQMAANAIETIELLDREHAARLAAEGDQRRLARANQRAAALQEVSRAITARLDLQEVVQIATDAARDLTPAAFGAFFYNVIDDRGESYTLYTLSGAPRSAFERFPLPRNTAVFGPTFNGEGIVRIEDVTADPRYGHNPPYNGMPPGHLPVCSYLAVPVITSGGEVAGGLFFGHPDPGVFSVEDEDMVAGIAAEAAVAIENARLYRERSETARMLEAALLPPGLPAIPGLELATRHRPAGAGNEVGGDFFDVFDLAGDGFAVVLGDVCGKGPRAAAVTALARYTLRAFAAEETRPDGLLHRLNDALLRQQVDGFATVAMASVTRDGDDVLLQVASGGHPLPIVVRRNGTTEEIGEVGTLLGVTASADLPVVEARLAPGDLLVLYTDGVTEAGAPANPIAEDRLRAWAAETAPEGPAAVVARFEAEAVEAAGGHPRDDIAVLAMAVAAGADGSGTRIARLALDDPGVGAEARAAVDSLAGTLDDALIGDLQLLATELVSNVIRHAGTPAGEIEVRLHIRETAVRLTVVDSGPGFAPPARPVPMPDGPGGWGLYLIDQRARRWGVEHPEAENCVWLELARPPMAMAA